MFSLKEQEHKPGPIEDDSHISINFRMLLPTLLLSPK